MKSLKKLTAIVASFMLSLPYLLMAQDDGTYIEDLNLQDSSYMDPSLAANSESTSSGNSTVYLIIAIVIIAAVIFFLIKKKKK